jgi:hypothetical protein
MIDQITKYVASDGQEFDTIGGAQTYQAMLNLADRLIERFSVYGKIENIHEVVVDLVHEGTIDLDALKEKYLTEKKQ